MLSDLFQSGSPGLSATLAIAFALLAAYAIAEIVARLARRVLRRVASIAPGKPASGIVKTMTRIIRVAVFLLSAAILTTPSINLAGVKIPVGLTFEQLSIWFFESGLRIAVITFLAILLTRTFGLVVERLEQEATIKVGPDSAERVRRIRTLGNLLHNSVSVTVLGIAALMILRQLSIDIMPILTGAGIVGLAIGFGAQTLVKDVISGFFVILENQVRVGDVATINGTGGAVESITLRTIVLRDVSGSVHVFPHGSVTTLANHTKDYSYYVIDLGVSYRDDVDQVMELSRTIGKGMMEDPRFGPDILAPLEVFGVDNFGPAEVIIKMRLKTRPTRQWDVGREFRRRIKIAFDHHGIEIPGPRMILSLASHELPAASSNRPARTSEEKRPTTRPEEQPANSGPDEKPPTGP